MRRPTVRILRTRYPDLAGVLMRDWERAGMLVRYRYGAHLGFLIVAVRPCWRWVPRLIFRYWPQWPSLAARLRLALGVVGFWLLGWLLFGAGR